MLYKSQNDDENEEKARATCEKLDVWKCVEFKKKFWSFGLVLGFWCYPWFISSLCPEKFLFCLL